MAQIIEVFQGRNGILRYLGVRKHAISHYGRDLLLATHTHTEAVFRHEMPEKFLLFLFVILLVAYMRRQGVHILRPHHGKKHNVEFHPLKGINGADAEPLFTIVEKAVFLTYLPCTILCPFRDTVFLQGFINSKYLAL